MYNYYIIHKSNSERVGLGPSLKSLKALKDHYFHLLEWSRKTNKEDVAYLIVNKGKKLHGYYNSDFVKDDSIKMDILLGLTPSILS